MGKIKTLQCGTLCCAAPYTISESCQLASGTFVKKCKKKGLSVEFDFWFRLRYSVSEHSVVP